MYMFNAVYKLACIAFYYLLNITQFTENIFPVFLFLLFVVCYSKYVFGKNT